MDRPGMIIMASASFLGGARKPLCHEPLPRHPSTSLSLACVCTGSGPSHGCASVFRLSVARALSVTLSRPAIEQRRSRVPAGRRRKTWGGSGGNQEPPPSFRGMFIIY